jgi:hypothetical protein
VSVSAGADEANDSGRGMCRWTVCESSIPGCERQILGIKCQNVYGPDVCAPSAEFEE